MALFLGALLVLAGCSGGGSGDAADSATAGVVFSVTWDRSVSVAGGDLSAFDLTDCGDVATVMAMVLDMDGNVLAIGGPWPCSARQGSIAGVPADRFVRVVVIGQNSQGRTIYYGASEPFFLPAGGIVDAGTITAQSFVPILTAPADGARVAIGSLTFIWTPVTGAHRYRITIADDPDFHDGAILQTIRTDIASFQFDTAGLDEDTVYFWRVQAEDGAGFLGEPSARRSFQVTRDLLAVEILDPPTGTQVLYGTPVAFRAAVADADGNPVAPERLADVHWRSDRDGSLARQLAFSTSALSPGTHTITLEVTGTDGLTGSAGVVVVVTDNAPPTATILSPADGAVITLRPGERLDCEGTGVDPEDGTLPESQMRWRMAYAQEPDILLWDAFGPAPAIDYLEFQNRSGIYRITLTVTDSEGATDTAAVEVELNIVVNQPPVATLQAPVDGAEYTIQTGGGLVCRGTGFDPEDGPLRGEQMRWQMARTTSPNTILWETYGSVAYIDFPVFGNRGGAYRITLTVTDSQGATGTDSVDVFVEIVTINQPPVATISSPPNGAFYYEEDVLINGSGWDPEDGVLPGSQLSWALYYSDDGVWNSTGWTDQGANTVIPASFFEEYNDFIDFQLRLTVTDSQGATGMDSVIFYYND